MKDNMNISTPATNTNNISEMRTLDQFFDYHEVLMNLQFAGSYIAKSACDSNDSEVHSNAISQMEGIISAIAYISIMHDQLNYRAAS